MKRRIFAAIIFFAITHAAHSYEFHTFVDQRCRIHSGLITSVDKESFSLWKLNGELVTLRRKDIGGVLTFDTARNPYSFRNSSSVLRPFLRKIIFGEGSSKESIVGWPYKFVENLIFYISVENKNYVLSVEQISSIEKLEPNRPLAVSREPTIPISLYIAPYLPHCFTKKPHQTDYLRPTRTIIDKIKIFVFFENLEKGFNRIYNFEDRTRVYARPFLFGKQRSRFGFLSNFGKKKEFNYNAFPLYFERTKGVDFRFQSRTRAGTSYQEWLPGIEPLFAVTSEIKSHFFNALFIGSLGSLKVGKRGFLKNDKETLVEDKYNVTTSLNYLALMGFDYLKYSFSLGPYYPIYAISTQETEIEILASSASPMFRFQYTGDKSKWRMFVSHTEYDLSEPSDVDIFFESDLYENETIEKFTFEGYNMRIGFDYQFNSDFMASIDEVVSWGKYKQNLSFERDDGTPASEESEFDFLHLNTTAYLQKDMGDYVFIQLRGNYYIYKYERDTVGLTKETFKGNDFSMGVTLGFIF